MNRALTRFAQRGVAAMTARQMVVMTPVVRRAAFSTHATPPDDYFDEDAEKEKVLLDVATSLAAGGVEHLNTVQDALTWEKINAARSAPVNLEIPQEGEGPEDLPDRLLSTARGQHLIRSLMSPDLAANMGEDSSVIPPEMLNFTVPYKRQHDPDYARFSNNREAESFGVLQQGNKICDGRLQRKGRAGVLGCHKIDLDDLNHFDVFTLARFLSQDGEIMSRKNTGLCAKCQRQVAKTIKRARNMGMLHHLGDYHVQEVRPLLGREQFHDVVSESKEVTESKTVL